MKQKLEIVCEKGEYDVGDILEFQEQNSFEGYHGFIAKVRVVDIDVLEVLGAHAPHPLISAGGVIIWVAKNQPLLDEGRRVKQGCSFELIVEEW
jgi:hypothetical protein